jgi:hypothetical protein
MCVSLGISSAAVVFFNRKGVGAMTGNELKAICARWGMGVVAQGIGVDGSALRQYTHRRTSSIPTSTAIRVKLWAELSEAQALRQSLEELRDLHVSKKQQVWWRRFFAWT